MKVYVSGKIAGLAEADYRDHFGRGSALIMSLGDEPVNPLEVSACPTEDCQPYGTEAERLSDGRYLHKWSCYLKYDLIAMLECDAIALLPNWPSSRGAQLEKYVAEQCDLRVFLIDHDYKGMKEFQGGK